MNYNSAEGVLAMWNDIRDDHVSNFEFWFKSEHFLERLGVPGFRLGRRYEAVSGAPRYLCYYLADTPEVFTSPAYYERLNNPTPLTRKLMSEAFQNMNRTICRRVLQCGKPMGSLAVTARFSKPLDRDAIAPMLDALSREDGIARCEFWSAVDQGPTIATEENLRGGDRKIASCILVDTLREADAERVSAQLKKEFGGGADVGIYRLLCEMERSDSPKD